MIPLYVEPFAGAAAVALQLLAGEGCHPPVSWMGGKRRLAPVILSRLGLTPGLGAGRVVLCDAGPWGWVWPALLDPAVSSQVAATLRGWTGEPIQSLWFRLRDEGPRTDPAEAVAQWLVLQARSASGAPVFWAEDGALDKGARPGREREAAGLCGANHPTLLQGDRRPGRYYPAWQNKVPTLRASDGRGVIRAAGIKGDKPYLRMSTSDGASEQGATQKGKSRGGVGGLVRIETLAERVDGLTLTLLGHRIDVIDGRAEDLPYQLHHNLVDCVVYLDPPYKGCTGYGWDVDRKDLVTMAREYARRGAVVGISEAVGLAEALGPGWTQENITPAGGRKPEWLTVYNPCKISAAR